MKRDRHDPNQHLLFGSPVSPVKIQPAKPIDRSRVYDCAESPPPLPGEHRKISTASKQIREGRRIIARMPVQKPLPEAVAAGRFGTDENGKPIRPSLDEVREITDTHVFKLISLLQAMDEDPIKMVAPRAELLNEFKRRIDAYAEDFGTHAAKQLEAYVRKEAGITVSPAWNR